MDNTKNSNDQPNISKLGGYVVDLRRLVDPDNKHWSATNPSIGYNRKKGYVVAIRSSNYVILANGKYDVTEGNTIKSQVWFSELDKDLKCKNLRKIDVSGVGIDLDRGLEDPKLFWRNNSWYMTCVTMEQDHTPTARMAIAKLDSKCTKIVSLEKFAGIDAKRPEKNWMVSPEPNPNFDFIYGPNMTIKDGVLSTWMTDNPEISMLRGNTNLHPLGDGSYLAVMHRTYINNKTIYVPTTFGTTMVHERTYVHYFVRFNAQGRIMSMSKSFIFYKPGVEFAAGLVARDKDFLISFGRWDMSSHIAVMPIDTVMKSLHPIKY